MSDDIIDKIKNTFRLEIIDHQYLSWGEQHWLQLDPNQDEFQPIVSVATVYPNRKQLSHRHFGYNEVVIGLVGETIHFCNGRKMQLSKGKIGYISNESEHQIINLSSEPVSFMSIVYSAIPKSLTELSASENIEFAEERINLNSIIEKFAQTIHMVCFLIDVCGNFVVDKNNLPTLCQICIRDKIGDCMLIRMTQTTYWRDYKIFTCKFGVSIFQNPVVVNNRILGYLSCGYGILNSRPVIPDRISQEMEQAYTELCFIPRNRLISVTEALSLISIFLVQLKK